MARHNMVAQTSDGRILLAKKLGGLFTIILGCLLTAVGVTFEYSGTTFVGVLLLVLGAVLLVLKIMRRNQERPF
ncbi:membrane-bound ClpP family serine protease [Bradyrhizobium japonicum USDA 38]|nr:membrane-bound ClpP family serine protease [Bradyrhizobium japonicum USDA 38]MCS3947569.1 membrane-bound ClpP family serine protease [Bradyrhizobium japonicum]